MNPQRHGFNHTCKLYQKLRFAALVCGAAFLFYGCTNDIEVIKAFSSPETLPSIHIVNYETTFTDSGIVRFYMKAPELKRFETDNEPFDEFPQGLYLVKYDNNRRVVSSISARYAKRFIREKKWEAKNDVVAVNAIGDTLKTEQLILDEQEEKIYSEQYVRIVRPDQIITGIGFESDQSMESWRIKNPRGTIYVQVNRQPVENPDSLFIEERTLSPMDIQP